MIKVAFISTVVVLAACLAVGNGCSGGAGDSSEKRDGAAAQENGGTFSEAIAASDSSDAAADDLGRPRTTTLVRGVEEASSPVTSIDHRVIEGNTAFAFRLLKKSCGSRETKNLFVSPLSVSTALAMTYNGASGKTAREMADALGFTGIPIDELNRSMADLDTALERADSAVQLTVANSLWARKGFGFRPEFLERSERFYGAKTATLDFADPAAPAVINAWVNDATRGLIDRIVQTISRDAVLYLMNAIYFKGRWQAAFDPAVTGDGEFYLIGGGVKTVPMMRRGGSFRYAEDENLQVVCLPYGDGRIAMYVLLPRQPGGLPVFVGGLDERSFTGWLSRLAPRAGDVIIPRFKIEYECALKDALKALGMGDAFDASAADFSKMSEADLFISAVTHKAVVDVNEEGTEAAAVTSVEMRPTSVEAPVNRFSFVADRPFFFVVRDDVTGSVLFAGELYDPSP